MESINWTLMEPTVNEHLFKSNPISESCTKWEGQGSNGGGKKHVGELNKKKSSWDAPEHLAGYPWKNSGYQRQVNKVVTQGPALTIKVKTGYLEETVKMWSNCCFHFSLQRRNESLLTDLFWAELRVLLNLGPYMTLTPVDHHCLQDKTYWHPVLLHRNGINWCTWNNPVGVKDH